MRALCLLNRHARSGEVAPDQLADILARAGLACTVRIGEKPGDLSSHLKAEGAEAELIVVGGGDGTINSLLSDLLALGKPVGILPLGTANDLASSLGMPRDIAEAAAIIAAGRVRRIDLGRVTGTGSEDRWFANVASVGFSTDVAKAHQGRRKKLLGVLAYPFAWLAAYRASRPFRMRLTVDGRTIETRCVQVAIGSGTRYGGGLLVSERASNEDGLLWIYYIKPIRLFGWLKLIPALVTGRHRKGGRSVELSGKAVRLETGRPLRINVDGDVDGETPADFAVHPGALTVFAAPS